MEANKRDKFVHIIYIVVIITLISINLSLWSVTAELDREAAVCDSIINSYSKFEIKKEKIIIRDTLFRTAEITSSFSVNGMKISSDDLIKYVNNLSSQNKNLSDSLEFYKVFYHAAKNAHSNDKFKVVYDKNNNTKKYSYHSTRIDSASIDNLYSKYDDAISELKIYKSVLESYKINVSDIKYMGNEIKYKVDAKQIDSALMLLPYYRKELKFDSKKNRWEIKIKKFF